MKINIKKRKLSYVLIGIVSIVAIALIIFTVQFIITKKDVNDIVKIEIVREDGFMSPQFYYLIDFETNTAYSEIKNAGSMSAESYRKATGLDSLFDEKSFDDNDKEYFVKKANLYGFFRWKEAYRTKRYTADEKCVEIYIYYKDGACKEIFCTAALPLTYSKMKDVFKKAFDMEVL